MEVKIHAEPVSEADQKKGKYGKYQDYEIECAVRTLIEAAEIRGDAEKMKYVQPLLKEKASNMQKAIGSMEELRAVAKKKIESDDEEKDADE